MRTPILRNCLLLACLAGLGQPVIAGEPPRASSPAPPFFELRTQPTDYAGPGRDEPPPAGVDEVLLGYFGPSDPAHPEAGDLWTAAQMAVDEANREGGFQGKPFRIVPGWSENPWGTGVRDVVRMAYAEKVWAIVGGIDGPSTHLAEQVVAKACLPLVSPASGDKTVNLAHVPWMFSLLPGDHLQAPVVAAAVSDRVGAEPFVLISGVDHDSRLFTEELSKGLAARRLVPRYRFELSPEKGAAEQIIARVVDAKPQAVVLIAGAHQSARLVAGLREAGFPGLVFGSAAMSRRRFIEEAGDAAEGVLFPLLYPVGCVKRTESRPVVCEKGAASEDGTFHARNEGGFAEAFEARTGRPPDYAAAHTYDAFRMLIAAVRTAGLNRARIRDALADLSPWSGLTGTVKWDPLGANARPVALGTIQHGRVVPATERAAANAG